MNFNLQNVSLRTQVIVIFTGFVILVAINAAITAHFQNVLKDTAHKIDAAKGLQLLSRQLASTARLYLNGDSQAKKSVEEISDAFEGSLESFTRKENTDTLAANSNLPAKIESKWLTTKIHINTILFEPALTDTVVQESKQVPLSNSQITTETTQKVLSVRNPKVERAANFIQKASGDLAKLGKKLTDSLHQKYNDTDNALTYASLIFLGIFLVAVVFLLVVIGKKVFKPILELNQITNDVSNGDLSKHSGYTINNEIGEIGRSVNKITDNLRNATAFINAIENGKLDEEFKGLNQENINDKGLESALLTMRDQMKRVAQEEQERKWSTEGLAKFIDILRSTDDDVYTLGDVIISNLVNYTRSNQGGIYVLNEEDEENKCLELISLYAFNTKKYDKRSYRLGEGLIGQTFLERDTIYLLEIPHEYISITSGLGGANPKAILLVPLKVNDIIYGVVELASFNEYKAYEIQFVEKLAESIASTIAGVKNNQRTKRLLEDSQSLTEQMRAQEEEMRQNMEELSATQEEMARKEVEMTAQLTAINNSLSSAEFDMAGKLIKANENYAKTFGYSSAEEITGLSFSALSAEDTGNLWEELSNGDDREGEFQKLTRSGEKITVYTTYTPVKNNNGHYYKVIELILSIASTQVAENTSGFEYMEEVEQALRQNLEELEITQEQLDRKLRLTETTMDVLNDAIKIITFGNDGKVLSINQAAQSATGLDNVQAESMNITAIVGDEVLVEAENGNTKELTILGATKVAAEIRQDITSELNYVIWI